MYLTPRQQTLLKLLINNQDSQTLDFYASQCDVSIRTIHKDLDEIERFLNDTNVSLVRKAGVGVGIEGSLEDRQEVLKLAYEDKGNNDILSTSFRRLRISSYLLNHKEGTSVQKLSEEYLVSKTSIVADLDLIEDWCKDFNLEFIKDRSGTRLQGLEKDIRHAMASLINDYKNIEGNFDNEFDSTSRLDIYTQYRLRNLFPELSLKKVEEILVENERRLNYRINDISFGILITHLMIMIQRIQSGDSLRLDAFIDKENKNNLAFKTANSIAFELMKAFKIEISSSEIQFIFTYLVSLGIQSNFRNLEFDEYVLSIDPKVKDITKKIIDLVSNITQINLSFDKPLYYGLLTHLKPMISRIKYGVSLKNPLLNEIKTKYASIFSVLYILVPDLNVLLNANINDDELSFMAIHFQAALERNAPDQKVVIVCPEGVGFSRLLANRINKFVPNIEIIDIIPAHKANQLDTNSIDFIISTIPLSHAKLPVILVSSLADFNDIRTISNFIIEKSANPNQIEYPHLKNLIDPNLIFVLKEDLTQNDIIHVVSQKLKDMNYVSLEFEQSVYDREKITPTCLGNAIAIPHGSQQFVRHSKIAIIIPKKEMNWSNGKVKLIFLIAMNLMNNPEDKDGFTDLYNLIDSPEMLDRLTNVDSIIDVLNIFK